MEAVSVEEETRVRLAGFHFKAKAPKTALHKQWGNLVLCCWGLVEVLEMLFLSYLNIEVSM